MHMNKFTHQIETQVTTNQALNVQSQFIYRWISICNQWDIVHEILTIN